MRLVLWLLVSSLLAVGDAAHAQRRDTGEIGVFFEPTATVHCGPSGGEALPGSGVLEQFVLFHIYVISIEVPGGQHAYEFSIDIDARVTPTVETLFPPGSTDFGVDAGNFKNYLVGTGAVCHGLNSTEALVRWEAVLFAPATDVQFCLGAASPSTFIPARPGYLLCNAGADLRPYNDAYEGCAVGNSTIECGIIPAAASSWGALKAKY